MDTHTQATIFTKYTITTRNWFTCGELVYCRRKRYESGVHYHMFNEVNTLREMAKQIKVTKDSYAIVL